MDSCDLTNKHCVPCEGGIPKLDGTKVRELSKQVPGWEARDDKLHKQFKFRDFKTAIKFVDQMADLAEREGHHPNFAVDFSRVSITLWTHAIGGLSENDFILAAKIDQLGS